MLLHEDEQLHVECIASLAHVLNTGVSFLYGELKIK